MSALHVTHPWILLMLPLALAPLIVPVLAGSFYPSLAAVPSDRLSAVLDAGLRLAGLVAIAGTVLGLAGPFTGGGMVERLGTGANILLLADRSGSMNDTFGGKVPSGGEESKAAAAKRLLGDFIARREHDLFGLALFATMPIEVMPLTAHRAAILAAVDAIDRPGLGYTNVGRGLALALDMLRSSDRDAARVILLISDGAAVIDPQVQLKLRAAFAETAVHLYWLFLRTANGRGIDDVPRSPSDDTPRTMPERHLDIFFKSLKVPYRAFQTEGADGVGEALQAIDRLEQAPLPYREPTPVTDLTGLAFAVAGLATLALAAAAAGQVELRRRHGLPPATARHEPA